MAEAIDKEVEGGEAADGGGPYGSGALLTIFWDGLRGSGFWAEGLDFCCLWGRKSLGLIVQGFVDFGVKVGREEQGLM